MLHKDRVKLYWKNGGWLSLAILGVILVICLILALKVVPILRHERIENVKANILESSDAFATRITLVEESVRSWLADNANEVIAQDSVATAYARLFDADTMIAAFCVEYRKGGADPACAFSQFAYISPLSGRVVCIDAPDSAARSDWDKSAAFFSHTKETQFFMGRPRQIPYLNDFCMPLVVMTPITPDDTCLLTIYCRFDAIRLFSNFQTPYPNGRFFIMDLDGIFVNTPYDTLINQPAAPWINEHFGPQVAAVQPSDVPNNIVSCANDELTFIKTYMYHRQRVMLYAVPTHELTADLSQLNGVMLLYCLSGMFVISLLCFHVIKSNTRKALRHQQNRKDMETAALIQKGMLSKPLRYPSVDMHSLLIPSKLIGGDLYYYFETDGLLYFCVGDVSGKGMPAAMFMSKTIGLFQYMSQHTRDVRLLAEQLNDELTKNNDTCMFVTMFIGIFDYRSGCLSYCNAGHDEPLFWDGTSDARPQYLKTSFNLPLGVDPCESYQSGTMMLPAGALLMLYTDGVTEAMNKNNEQYGEERLSQLLAANRTHTAETINGALIDDIRAFVGRREQSDDITILTLKINPTDPRT